MLCRVVAQQQTFRERGGSKGRGRRIFLKPPDGGTKKQANRTPQRLNPQQKDISPKQAATSGRLLVLVYGHIRKWSLSVGCRASIREGLELNDRCVL